jgi:hypothetical protein
MQTLSLGGSTIEEDPIYQFKNGAAETKKEAVKRLIKIAKELKVKGTLIYENVTSNFAFAGKPQTKKRAGINPPLVFFSVGLLVRDLKLP